ncbi:nucleotide pyrophosphohydrolase [Streptomyces sp. N35]|uniref:nucleotide pyrophosphohydrolase n=1 Tax=Streptomyces sp. N35 TaxID=2795730 RepID=UPI0018F65790|nr:nucleotide pyrophosphohydrolase [Streptomyces sp. N35]
MTEKEQNGTSSKSDLDVRELQRRLAAFAAARDWGPYHTPKNLTSALSVEAAELVEIFQWLTPEQSAHVMDDPDFAHRVRDEVADVLAYLLQFCEVLGVDALEALADKIDRNERRYPVGAKGPAVPGRIKSTPGNGRSSTSEAGRSSISGTGRSSTSDGHSAE